MTRMTGPDYVVMCNLINTYIHTYYYLYATTSVQLTLILPLEYCAVLYFPNPIITAAAVPNATYSSSDTRPAALQE